MPSEQRKRERGLLSKLFSVFLCIVLASGCGVPTAAFADETASAAEASASAADDLARAPGMGIALRG